MAFSLFGKRDKGTELEPESAEPEVSPAPEPSRRGLFGFGQRPSVSDETAAEEPARRSFFDRMRQAVTRTRETLSESISSVVHSLPVFEWSKYYDSFAGSESC